MEYRECFIPTCKNDSKNSPDKIFVRVREDLKEKWCREAKAECFKIYRMYCCEDHLEPREDLINYYQCKLLNEEPKLKRSALLRNIGQDTNEDLSELNKLLLQPPSTSQPLKRKRDDFDKSKSSTSLNKSKLFKRIEDIAMPSTSTCSTLAININAATQCEIKMVDKSTNYKTRKQPANITTTDILQSSQETSSAATPSLFGCTSETEESSVCDARRVVSKTKKIMLDLVINKPRMYLGLPKQYIWLIDHIVEKSTAKIDNLHIIVSLLKIKQNDSLERISDQFNISRTKLSSMILTGIEVLGNFFQNFVYCPQPKQIKENLPLVFKIRYSDVQMIIDCFEIQISKPSNPLKQAQTWSQYKSSNTVKYLIGCTPNGFISFISKGYGGRISDKAIVAKSDLINVLKPNAVILADRGFKEIETQLNARNIKLLRPPSVYTGTKQTTREALQSKVIASLRVHIERVIRRVREYTLLKPHSVVNYKYVPYLDEIVLIVCGLINLQGEIIKSY
ncbi:uncharacterized protein LOC124646216 isoform X1 [Helicoverpa zea]|uniref:uncharacterized protein LOC124646216 isoform X1 n=2 Tax=Helicoverpa zea TaxID=7113 RepID=UPI001F5613FB|nr:uncharacterized protein LOC124646216 isoform X1 [Helicoverpa zea]